MRDLNNSRTGIKSQKNDLLEKICAIGNMVINEQSLSISIHRYAQGRN